MARPSRRHGARERQWMTVLSRFLTKWLLDRFQPVRVIRLLWTRLRQPVCLWHGIRQSLRDTAELLQSSSSSPSYSSSSSTTSTPSLCSPSLSPQPAGGAAQGARNMDGREGEKWRVLTSGMEEPAGSRLFVFLRHALSGACVCTYSHVRTSSGWKN